MAAPPRFEQQLFISFAHLDNETTTSPEGWVSRFHASLEAVLSTRLGRKATIWRDTRLTGGELFAEEIIAQLPKTALMISVLTPRYVESEWCTREAHDFCAIAQERGMLVIDNKPRIIKVIKTPVEDEATLPAVMHGMTGYDFYTLHDDAPVELDSAYGEELALEYRLKVAKLAWDVAQRLKRLESLAVPVARPSVGTPAATPEKATTRVFLAQCTRDQRAAREALAAELELHGYTVLPDRALPMEEGAHLEDVRELLRTCSLSIHLIGESYGVIPEGSGEKSIVVLQHDAAVERSRDAGLRRVIWLPAGTASSNAEQQAFIEALHSSAELQQGADLVTADLETVKRVVHATLDRVLNPLQPTPVENETRGRLVYLICDARDRSATIPLRKQLKAHGVEVQIPLFEGDAAAVRHENDKQLVACDALLVFYAAGDELWKRTVDDDVKKLRALRGERAVPPVFTYLSGEATPGKRELVELEEPNVINALDASTPPSLEVLLAAVAAQPK